MNKSIYICYATLLSFLQMMTANSYQNLPLCIILYLFQQTSHEFMSALQSLFLQESVRIACLSKQYKVTAINIVDVLNCIDL